MIRFINKILFGGTYKVAHTNSTTGKRKVFWCCTGGEGLIMFDLQLDKITEGALICTIKADGSTGSLFKVGEFSALHGRYRLISARTGKHMGLIPVDGIGYYATHLKDNPHFFYSVNPEHVEKAQKAIETAQKKKQEKEQEDKAKIKELQSRINALLQEYGASLDVSLEGDTHGVEAELFLSIGQYGVRMD